MSVRPVIALAYWAAAALLALSPAGSACSTRNVLVCFPPNNVPKILLELILILCQGTACQECEMHIINIQYDFIEKRTI